MESQKSIKEIIQQHYDVLQLIGRGQYGEVYKCQDKNSNKIYTVKFIQDFLYSDYQSKQLLRELQILRFIREQSLREESATAFQNFTLAHRVISNIDFIDNHKNIKTAYVLIVMEYVGSDLRKMMSSKRSLSEQDVIKILYGMLVSLDTLSQAAIIHRDIKPANILVNENDNFAEIKLCDFGMARTIHDDTLSNNRRQRNLSKDVVAKWYKPLEILSDDPQYDCSLDVWGCGCILAELLLSSHPYKEQSMQSYERILFSGKSIFSKKNVDSITQIMNIFEIMGIEDNKIKIAKTDLTQLTNTEFKERLKNMYWHTSEDLLEVLYYTLEINPNLRKKPSELLELPIFNQFKKQFSLPSKSNQLQLQIDINNENDSQLRGKSQWIQYIHDEIQIWDQSFSKE